MSVGIYHKILSFPLQSPVIEDPPTLLESGDTQDVVFDDSGVSDVTSNSTSSTGEGHSHSDDNHVTKGVGSHDLSENGSNTSERWAHVSVCCEIVQILY